MTEREMLELAAKAAGIDNLGDWSKYHGAFFRGGMSIWNPLTIKGDCADMEARLMIGVEWEPADVVAVIRGNGFTEKYADHNNDRQYARMMASTRAAAAVGGAMG